MENDPINIVEVITQTINNLFSNLFSSIDNSLYSILDDLLFVGPDILTDSNLSKILGGINSSGLILICNSLLLGFALYYACSYTLSHITFSQVQKPVSFMFKLFLCAVAINSSLFIVKGFLALFSNITLAIREVGEVVFNQNICLSTFIEKFNANIYLDSVGLNIFSLEGLMKGFVSIGLLNLAISYSIRYVLIKVFIIFSPFAFAALVTQKTAYIFKAWFKLFVSLFALQILVSLILLISFAIEFSSDAFSKFIYMGSIYALIRANSIVRDFMGGLSTDFNIAFPGIRSFFSK